MARTVKVLLGVWLVWMFASGSAFAVVREIDLGVLAPGSVQGLFGTFPLGESSTDIYEFDLSGTSVSTVGASLITMLTGPNSVNVFQPVTVTFMQWDSVSSTFTEITHQLSNTGAVVFAANLSPAAGSDGSAGNDRHYQVTVNANPTGTGIATYGGSLAVVTVPEPSMTFLLLGGLVSIGFLGRRRLTGSAA